MTRYLLLLLVLIVTDCKSTEGLQPETEEAERSDTLFVGRLTENVPLGVGNPSAYCLEDGQLYETATHRMGQINVFDVATMLVLANIGRRDVVAVRGRLEHGLDKAIEPAGPCPKEYDNPQILQMRSDWTSPECGFNLGKSTKAKLAGLDYIVAEGVERVELVEVLDKAPTARLRISNPFEVSLTDVTVVWHYETRAKGKPMGHEETTRLTLAPGASEVIEAEAILLAPTESVKRRGGSRLEWVELRKTEGPVHLSVVTIVR